MLNSLFFLTKKSYVFIIWIVENNIPWAHIDIAGVSWTMKGGKNSISKIHSPGATAFGVRLIDKFLNKK